MVKTPDIAEPREPQVPDRLYAGARRRVLFIVCFGCFLVLLDTTALNIATPALGKEFGDGISNLQWVVNSYTLVFAGLLLAAGAAGDRIGVRRSYAGWSGSFHAGLSVFRGCAISALADPRPSNSRVGRRDHVTGFTGSLISRLSRPSRTEPRGDHLGEHGESWICFWPSARRRAYNRVGVAQHFLGKCSGWYCGPVLKPPSHSGSKIRSTAPYRLGWTTNNLPGPAGDDLWFNRSRSPRLEQCHSA